MLSPRTITRSVMSTFGKFRSERPAQFRGEKEGAGTQIKWSGVRRDGRFSRRTQDRSGLSRDFSATWQGLFDGLGECGNFIGRQAARIVEVTSQDDFVELWQQPLEHAGGSLSRVAANTSSRGCRGKASFRVCSSASMDATLWAVSTMTVGCCDRTSTRAGQEFGQTATYGCVRDPPAGLAKTLHRCQSDGCVGGLMGAEQAEPQVGLLSHSSGRPLPVVAPAADSAASFRQVRRAICTAEFLAQAIDCTFPRSGHLLDDFGRFAMPRPGNNGHPGFDDARFLESDRGQCVTQLANVVEADAGDDAH